MPKYLVKRVLWLFILLIAALTLWRIFVGVDTLITYYHQGANPTSALNIVPNVPPDLSVKLNWQPDDADTGRSLEPAARTDIQSAYLRAWLQWNISLLKQRPYGLETYFVGPALANINAEVNALAVRKWLVEQADMAHSLQLHFYSADGSIVSFTDWNADVVTIVHDKGGAVLFTGESVAVYQVVMFLEDGNWRVRHWVQASNTPVNTLTQPLHTLQGFVGIDRTHDTLMLDKRPYNIAGINYYPQATPWNLFWPKYNPTVIDADFTIIHALGLNVIRIFIPFDQFGGAHVADIASTPTASTSTSLTTVVQDPMNKLADLLKRASLHNLRVIVTLFDFHSDYTLLHWPAADRYLEALLTRFRNDPAILAWDLKNEPDQDYRTAGKYLVDNWLLHIAYLARQYDSYHLLTIGWSSAQAAHTYIPSIDFVSFHYYAPAADFARTYALLQAAVPRQPIVLGEFGLPTWNSFFFPNGHSEAEQTTYYADILRALRTSKNAGYIAWTLYDFPAVPSVVAGAMPWQTGPQKYMGVLFSNGKPKPAALLLAPTASLTTPTAPRLIKPFWLTLFFASIVLCSSTAFLLKRWRTRQSRQ